MRLWYLAALLFACQPELDRAPAAPECSAATSCSEAGGPWPARPPPGRTPVEGDAGATGEGGGAGEDGAAGAFAQEALTGSVRDLTDDSFRASFAYEAPALVRSQGAASASVTAAWDGAEPFILSGFPLRSPLWLSVEPSAGSAHLRTLHPLPLPRSAPVDLGLVRADTLDLIFLLQTVPAERIARRGHVALLLTHGEGLNAGIAGVSVGLAEAGVLAYAVGGTWTDVEDRTDPSGRVVLGNISAAPFPGLTRRISLRGARQGFIDVVVVADAISLVEARLPAQP